MQLKNNASRNIQLFYYMAKNNKSEPTLDFVHIPGGATVEIDDDIYLACCKSKTTVNEIKLVETPLVEDNIGAVVQTDKKPLVIKEYYETGRQIEISLVASLIKSGELSVVQRVSVTMAEIEKHLASKGIPVKDMADEQKLALYDQLA